jgi:hypothetical protein
MHHAEWRKSSFSSDGGECVELTWLDGRAFARDSKNPSGPTISIDLLALVESCRAGAVNRAAGSGVR